MPFIYYWKPQKSGTVILKAFLLNWEKNCKMPNIHNTSTTTEKETSFKATVTLNKTQWGILVSCWETRLALYQRINTGFRYSAKAKNSAEKLTKGLFQASKLPLTLQLNWKIDFQLSKDQKHRGFRYQIAYRKQSW